MKEYKYIHFLGGKDSKMKFYPQIIRMIDNPQNGFNPDDHLFVTSDKNLCELFSGRRHIEYIHVYNGNSAKVFNTFANRGEWLFVHCMPATLHALFINPKYHKRIIWRTWGSDGRFKYREGSLVKNLIKKNILEMLWKKEVKRFRAIGIGNLIDFIDIKHRFGEVPMYRLGYLGPERDDLVKRLRHGFQKDSSTVNILIGHSGYYNDNHIELLKKFKKFSDKDICIHLVLSYGNSAYIESVKRYVSNNWTDKILIHEEFLPYEKYVEFLGRMDIAVFDAKESYALGNIGWMLFFEKLIILNRNGVIKEAFDLENIPYRCSDEIETMSFEDLIQKPDFPVSRSGLSALSYDESVYLWKTLLNDLERDKRN